MEAVCPWNYFRWVKTVCEDPEDEIIAEVGPTETLVQYSTTTVCAIMPFTLHLAKSNLCFSNNYESIYQLIFVLV